MVIKAILLGWLGDFPNYEVTLADGSTVGRLLDTLNVEDGIVVVNDHARERDFVLSDGDIVRILPELYAG